MSSSHQKTEGWGVGQRGNGLVPRIIPLPRCQCPSFATLEFQSRKSKSWKIRFESTTQFRLRSKQRPLVGCPSDPLVLKAHERFILCPALHLKPHPHRHSSENEPIASIPTLPPPSTPPHIGRPSISADRRQSTYIVGWPVGATRRDPSPRQTD